MEKFNYEFPTPFESERLILRSYQPGDGSWFYAMSLRNREHLSRFEADNVAANVESEAAAEELVGELEAAWRARNCFFIGAFEKQTCEFVAQIYVGPVDWNPSEFQVGYFADIDHEGQGFVTEGVKAVLGILFGKMNAHRVRLECDESNSRSIRVAERCNMTREGYLRENRHNPDGTYSGSYIYGLLQTEYQADNSVHVSDFTTARLLHD
jgi:RimJ/RimL family protein N-acetyltransferase